MSYILYGTHKPPEFIYNVGLKTYLKVKYLKVKWMSYKWGRVAKKVPIRLKKKIIKFLIIGSCTPVQLNRWENIHKWLGCIWGLPWQGIPSSLRIGEVSQTSSLTTLYPSGTHIQDKMCVCVCVCVYMCTHTYIHWSVKKYIHTHTHTYI